MSSLLYTVLNLFESPRGHLAEITRNSRPSLEPSVTEWVWIEYRHVLTLQPLEGRDDLVFREGQLHVGQDGGELRWSTGRTDALVRVDFRELPPSTRALLELHFT